MMIKFFRHIRQSMLMENKSGKYFKYAIGEIILVVIGILIALQVNNVNEKRKLKESEISLYKNALKDVIAEETNIETQIRWFKHYQDVNYQLYQESIGDIQYASNPDVNVLIWTNISRPLIKDNYSEKLGNMTNQTIQDLFRDYIWREQLAMEAKSEFNNYKFNTVRPYLAKYGVYDNSMAYNNTPYDFMSLDDTNVLNVDKLRSQYGTTEFDQILYGLRHSTSWCLHVLDRQLVVNRNLHKALTAYINEDFKTLETIEPLKNYW